MIVGGKDVGDRPLILAPMEEVTNPPFRKFCKRYGADWLYSEFVSADALVRSINKTVKKLTIEENERPVTIQIYGRFIDSMVEAAKIVEEVQPDFIDINFGCPVKRVAAKGAGAAVANERKESDMESGEGFDRIGLSLMGKQVELLKTLYATGKPVVLVMIQGRPLELNWAAEHIPAILTAW